MQKIATRVFIAASVVFGVFGSLFWVTMPRNGEPTGDFQHFVMNLMGVTVSIILSSFALSVAGKYLANNDD